MEAPGYWFKSTLFEIEPGEDGDINPGIYGRQLAVWLKDKLEQLLAILGNESGITLVEQPQ